MEEGEFELELLEFPELLFAIALVETDRNLQILGTNSAFFELQQTGFSENEFLSRTPLLFACTHHRSIVSLELKEETNPNLLLVITRYVRENEVITDK